MVHPSFLGTFWEMPDCFWEWFWGNHFVFGSFLGTLQFLRKDRENEKQELQGKM